jgi:hypothetical protein
MPTSSSLVTNLPADFNTFGQAVDTSMSELLGGTTGQVLSKTSATNMDFTWVTPSAGSNYLGCNNFIINGGLDIWQRGTSFTGTAPYYNADRWNGARAGAVAGATWSQQTINGNLGTTPAQAILYSLRVSRDSGNTSTAIIQTANGLDAFTSIPLAGQTVVMSFYAKAGANFSAASNALAVKLVTGTGLNQNYLVASYTGLANAISTTATLTTSWQRFQYTATLPTNTGEVALDFSYTPVGTAGAADNFEITGVQLEIGSTATQFGRAGGTIQGELAACQRYYYRQGGLGTYQRFGSGIARGTTVAEILTVFPVSMRVKPTSIDYSTLLLDDTVTSSAVTLAVIDSVTSGNNAVNTTANATLTQYRFYYIEANNSTNAYLGFSAEL